MTKKIIAVSTGQLFRSNRLNDNINQKPIFVMQNMDLVIHFFPDEDSSDKVIEKELTSIIKNYKYSAWWRISLRILSKPLLATFFLGLLVLGVLGILHTFEESFFEIVRTIFEDGNLSSYFEMLGGSAIILLVMLLFFPNTFKAEELNPRERIADWLSGETRVTQRIHIIIKYLLEEKIVRKIEIWNAGVLTSWVLKTIIDCAAKYDVAVSIRFSCVENQSHIQKYRDEYHDIIGDGYSNLYSNTGVSTVINVSDVSYRLPLLNSIDRQIIALVVACFVRQVNMEKVYISTDLIKILSKYANIFEGNTESQLGDFFDRFSTDVGLASWIDGYLVAAITTITAIASCDSVVENLDNVSVLIDRVIEDKYAIDQLGSLGCIILVYHIVKHRSRHRKIKLAFCFLEQAIGYIRRNEEYFLVPVVSNLIDKLTSIGICLGSDCALISLSPTALDSLLTVYERSGDFDKAINVADVLKATNFYLYSIKKCRLWERLGKYDDALEVIESLNLLVNKDSFADIGIKVAFFTEYAWILVNVKRDGTKIEIQKALSRSYNYISLLVNNSEELSIYVWRYWNTWYNLYEWDGEYEAALLCLERCLRVPGVEMKWRSGTYTNLCIAYRNLWKNEGRDKNVLLQSLRYGRKGLLIKVRNGDLDEIPISAYHVSLSIFEFSQSYMSHPRYYVRKCMILIQYALLILEKNGSEKKKLELQTLSTTVAKFLNHVDFDYCIRKAKAMSSKG